MRRRLLRLAFYSNLRNVSLKLEKGEEQNAQDKAVLHDVTSSSDMQVERTSD